MLICCTQADLRIQSRGAARVEMEARLMAANKAAGRPASTAGPSILEMMWEELDSIVDRLCEEGAAAEDGLDSGRAQGMAHAIAIVEQPYQPNIEDVRARAMERRAAREADE